VSDTTWHRAAATHELPVGEMKQVQIGARHVALYNVEGTVYATDDICSHADASLSSGYLEGDTVECPLHQGRFHIPTGKAMGAPVTVDIATFPVKIEGADILVALPTI
jgi:nitrite reductase/ring-hydroxylating ferredoxin subunit